MQALDDLLHRSGVHHHLIASGRGAGGREEPDLTWSPTVPGKRIGQDARSLDQLGAELGQGGQAVLTDGFGREQRDHGYPVGQ